MGCRALNFALANGKSLWSVLLRDFKKRSSAGRRHRSGFSFRSARLCIHIPFRGHSPPAAKIRKPDCGFLGEAGKGISRRNFFKHAGLTGAALAAGTAFGGSFDAAVEFYITDKDTREPIQGAHIRAVHRNNPSLVYEDYTDENGYAGLDLPTAVGRRDALPEGYELHQNFPNPFNDLTSIEFALPEPEHVNIKIYNELGQFVTELSNDTFGEGTHTVRWNGYDRHNLPMSDGMYFAHIQTDNLSKTIKMIKMAGAASGSTKKQQSLNKIAQSDLYDFYVTKDDYDSLNYSELITGEPQSFEWDMEKTNEAPHALYNIPEKGYVNEPVQFTNLSVDDDGSVVESVFDFGDGDTVTLDNTEHRAHLHQSRNIHNRANS